MRQQCGFRNTELFSFHEREHLQPQEWVGVILFGAAICCGLVFMLWLVCKFRTQQKRDKVIITQALLAIENG